MRNHKKVKAIRSKFGIAGYGIWVMLLEYLTGNDGNEFEYSDLEIELMSGDFGVSATEIRNVVDYCISLEMLFNKNGFIHSPSLDERLAPVYQKRGVAKEISAKQSRSSGKFTSSNTECNGVSVAEMPQSKVKKSKVKKSKEQAPLRGYEIPFVGNVLKAWEEWEQYRRQRGKKITPLTAKKQINLLGGRPDFEIIEMINTAITRGWEGLYEINKNNQNYVTRQGNQRASDAVIPGGTEFGSF